MLLHFSKYTYLNTRSQAINVNKLEVCTFTMKHHILFLKTSNVQSTLNHWFKQSKETMKFTRHILKE